MRADSTLAYREKYWLRRQWRQCYEYHNAHTPRTRPHRNLCRFVNSGAKLSMPVYAPEPAIKPSPAPVGFLSLLFSKLVRRK